MQRYLASPAGQQATKSQSIDPLQKSHDEIVSFLKRFQTVDLSFESMTIPSYQTFLSYWGISKGATNISVLPVIGTYTIGTNGKPRDLNWSYQKSLMTYKAIVPVAETTRPLPMDTKERWQILQVNPQTTARLSNDFLYNRSDFGVGLFVFRTDGWPGAADDTDAGIISQIGSLNGLLCWTPIMSFKRPEIPAKISCNFTDKAENGNIVYDVTKVSAQVPEQPKPAREQALLAFLTYLILSQINCDSPRVAASTIFVGHY